LAKPADFESRNEWKLMFDGDNEKWPTFELFSKCKVKNWPVQVREAKINMKTSCNHAIICLIISTVIVEKYYFVDFNLLYCSLNHKFPMKFVENIF
jgi:hypothetical protein